MTRTQCDICKAKGPVNDLRPNYQTAAVKEVCADCETRINKALDEIRAVSQRLTEGSLKAFISRLVEKFA